MGAASSKHPSTSQAKAETKEKTPIFDTFEARRNARIAVGAVGSVLLLLAGFGVYRSFTATDVESDLPDEGRFGQHGSAVDAPDPRQLEEEAEHMFRQAELVAGNGNTDRAMSLLKKITKSYPRSAVAKEAKAALDRPKQGLPLFVEGPAVAAKAVRPEPPRPEVPAPVVDVVQAAPAAPAQSATHSEVELVLPAAPAEPRKTSGSTLAAAAAGGPTYSLPPGFHARPEAGVHGSGWPLEIVGDRDGATMVLVPGGTFIMGRDDGAAAEAPAHQVRLSTFYIDQHEVSVSQFGRFERENARNTVDKGKPARDGGSPDPAENLPMVRVTSKDAQEYARWAGKALPTEAQWEMAARTPDGRPYPWGDGTMPGDKPFAYKNVAPVMSCPGDQSPYGVYDLAGNAWEWTADWYDPAYFKQFRDNVADKPIGPPRSRSRQPQMTIKGGSKSGQSSWREGMKADAQLAYLGFRCALTAPQPAGPAPVQAGSEAAPASGNALVPF
jgi:formylglycine-generating enzyme required for sulfatase activity